MARPTSMSSQVRLTCNKSNQALRCEWIAAVGFLLVVLVLATPAMADAAPAAEAEADLAPAASVAAPAEGSAPAPEPARASLFERVRVVGSPETSATIPGSVTYLGQEQLEDHGYEDINRILSHVPGVNLQQEEGYGLRPNIGFRGSGSERSSKITLLEDGTPIAPAPYAAPAAYYFPTTGRMAGIEVRKGSSSIQQGPLTTAGVLNLISSAIPDGFEGRLNVAAGSDDTRRGRFLVGDSGERFGAVFEAFRFETDGFKRLDNGGPTGVELDDYMVKLRLNSSDGARLFQALELKLGKTEQFGHETYLGLTQEDFRRDPYRRYAGSQADTIDTDHEQLQLRYMLRPGDRLDFTATAYRNDFFRNWRKLGKVDAGAGFVDIADVLGDPTRYGAELALLRGDADSAADALNLRNNRRDYYSQGLQLLLGYRPGGARSRHELELGLRIHEDEEDRFQDEDLFEIVGGTMRLTTTGEPGSQSNRISRAEALAFHAQDTVRLGRLTLTPGLRVESIDFERLDYGKQDPTRSGDALEIRSNDVLELIPGFGVTYLLSGKSTLFAGAHKGFAPPGPGRDDRTDPEESINYEIGYRRKAGTLELQLAAFLNDYDNLLGADTLSAGGTGEGDQWNGGAVRATGFEAALSHDPGSAAGLRVGLPLSFSYTYTEAEFRSSFDSEFEPWGDVQAGDTLPYVPLHQAALGLGVVLTRWTFRGDVTYQDRMRTVAGQGPIPEPESTDDHVLFDLSAGRSLTRDLRLFVQIRNLTDETYVAARRPAGARPGLSRTALVGLAFDF